MLSQMARRIGCAGIPNGTDSHYTDRNERVQPVRETRSMAITADERRAILLRGDDNVAVAAQADPAGDRAALRIGPERRGPRADRGSGTRWPWPTSSRARPVRKYGQIIGFASQPIPAGRMGSRAQRPGRPVRARLRHRHRAGPAAARGRAADVPGLPAARRPRRHAELCRRHQHGELLGQHLAAGRRAVPRRRLEARLPERRRRLRHHPQGRLRDAVRGPGPPDARTGAGRVRQPSERRGVSCIVGLGCEVSYTAHFVEAQDLVTLGGTSVRQDGGRPRC